MDHRKLKALLSRRPFRPLRIALDNGEAITIRHPETVVLNPYWIVAVNGMDILYSEPQRVTSVTLVRSRGDGA